MSRWLVGSSMSKSCGDESSTPASARRVFWPPLSVSMGVSSGGSSKPQYSQGFTDLSLELRRCRDLLQSGVEIRVAGRRFAV